MPAHEGGGTVTCVICHGAGVLDQRLVPLADALRESGQEHPVGTAEHPVGTAEQALQSARYHLGNAAAEVANAAALYAIAEQLALLNTHMAELADNVSYYVANKV